MRQHTRTLICLSVTALALAACASSSDTAHATADNAPAVAPDATAVALDNTAPLPWNVVAVGVNGMSCPKCAENIGKSLKSLDGVASADVNLELGDVRVAFTDGAAHPSAKSLATVIRDAGFTPVRIAPAR